MLKSFNNGEWKGRAWDTGMKIASKINKITSQWCANARVNFWPIVWNQNPISNKTRLQHTRDYTKEHMKWSIEIIFKKNDWSSGKSWTISASSNAFEPLAFNESQGHSSEPHLPASFFTWHDKLLSPKWLCSVLCIDPSLISYIIGINPSINS